ncbi:MAG: hypothetical protein PVH68_10450 [Armatimonadota bacterium]|jgi:hypothetical protein
MSDDAYLMRYGFCVGAAVGAALGALAATVLFSVIAAVSKKRQCLWHLIWAVPVGVIGVGGLLGAAGFVVTGIALFLRAYGSAP